MRRKREREEKRQQEQEPKRQPEKGRAKLNRNGSGVAKPKKTQATVRLIAFWPTVAALTLRKRRNQDQQKAKQSDQLTRVTLFGFKVGAVERVERLTSKAEDENVNGFAWRNG